MDFDQINLTTRKRIDHRIRFLLFGGIIAVVSLAALLNLYTGYQAYSERQAYQEKIDQLQPQIQRLAAAEMPGTDFSPKAYEELMNQSLGINRLIALDLFPWAHVLDALEKALPDAVVIDRFRPVDGFTRIDLAGHTDSPEQLVRFQESLEASDMFASVVLENMGLGDISDGKSPSNSGRRTEFQLHCRLQLDAVFPEESYGLLRLALKKTKKRK
jgi:Tfp pilus assembly protein PilN